MVADLNAFKTIYGQDPKLFHVDLVVLIRIIQGLETSFQNLASIGHSKQSSSSALQRNVMTASTARTADW